jgi:hypothetical protein
MTGHTALTSAAARGQLECARLLIKACTREQLDAANPVWAGSGNDIPSPEGVHGFFALRFALTLHG